MALVKCPECGCVVSDSAETCPSCGHPMRRPEGGRARKPTSVLVLSIVCLPLSALFTFAPQDLVGSTVASLSEEATQVMSACSGALQIASLLVLVACVLCLAAFATDNRRPAKAALAVSCFASVIIAAVCFIYSSITRGFLVTWTLFPLVLALIASVIGMRKLARG